MKVWVVRNKTVPIEILQLLSTDPDPSVRAAVASKNCLPLKLMAQLAEDGDVTVRQGIAYNKNTDREILRKLSSDPSDLVSSPARERFGMWPRP